MLGIITIDYKNPQLTIDFCNRELKKINVPFVCVIVVNAATEEEIDVISKGTKGRIVGIDSNVKKGQLFILPSKENLGFAKGNNLGVNFLCEKFQIDHILFSNNDIEIKSTCLVEGLISKIDNDAQIGAIGPRVVGLDGNDQSPHYKIISPFRQMGWKMLPFLRRKNRAEDIVTQRQTSGFCYWVSGAFFLMKKDDFIKIDGFDPNTFLYYEEPILAERLKRIDKKMFFLNDVGVLHYEGGSSSKVNKKILWNDFLVDSACYYYKEYLHYPSAMIFLYKIIFKSH